MRVLLSAYACEPGKGSEPEVGLRAMLAAASRHEVWVLTRTNNVDSLTDFLRGHPLADRIRLVGLDTHGLARKLKGRLGIAGIQWYYRAWQRLAATEGQRLDREIDFDVVHHATFASYWAPVGVATIDKPLVVGPVGGGVGPPRRLVLDLGLKGLITDGARLVTRSFLGRLPGSRTGIDRARVLLVQNAETLDLLGSPPNARLLSNALCIELDPPGPAPAARTKEIVSSGRLIPFKGATTAVRALSHVEDREARLVFVGDGPERRRIQRQARRLDLAERVEILGWQPRHLVMQRVREAAVLVHSAIHDEAGLAVAEALTLGTPVVGYTHGGPAEVMKHWPDTSSTTVTAGTPSESARLLAKAIDAFLAKPPPIPAALISPQRRFDEALLDAYQEAASS